MDIIDDKPENVAAARAAGWQTLLRYVGGARDADPEAYRVMQQALRELDPRVTVQIRCQREYSSVGADAVSLTTSGGRSVSNSFSLRQGGVGRASFGLFEVIDLAERVVARIAAAEFAAGRGQAAWGGTGDDGRRLATGLYFVRMRTDGAAAGAPVKVIVR